MTGPRSDWHLRWPPDRTTHAALPPFAESQVTPESRLLAGTGVALAVVAPLPSSPTELPPQHWTAPPVVSRQPNPSDIWIAERLDGTPEIDFGVGP